MVRPIPPWLRRWGLILLWTFLGGLIIAAFFLAAFFNTLSPIAMGDPGAVLLLVPLLTGFLLGIILTDEEIVVAAGVGVLAALIAVALVGLFLFSPVIAGITQPDRAVAAFNVSRMFLSSILIFPVAVVGSSLGRGLGDIFLPSVRGKKDLEALREETRQWHQALDRVERGPGEAGKEKKD